MSKKLQQKVYTKKCSDGRACAPVDWKAVEALGKRAAKQANKNLYTDFRLVEQAYYIPDAYDICDACLLAKYKLYETSGGCGCCEGRDDLFDGEDIRRVLRELEAKIK